MRCNLVGWVKCAAGVLVCALAIGVLNSGTAFGEDPGYAGEGNDEQHTEADCNHYSHGVEFTCPDGTGGASWHIYRTGAGGANPQYTDTILSGEIYKSTIEASEHCGNYDWYAVYGWDGHNGAHWGPLNWSNRWSDAWTDGQLYYNTTNAADSIDDDVANDTRITERLAQELYMENWNGTIPGDKGYFCIDTVSHFKGMAGVGEGNRYSSSANKRSTGWKDANGEANLVEMDCPNTGCQAKFVVGLMTESGRGETKYWIYKDDVIQILYNGVEYTPSESGEYIPSTGFLETLYPGQTMCYKIKFRPDSKSTATVTEKACIKARENKFSGYSRVYLNSNHQLSSSTGWKNAGTLADNTAWLGLIGCNDGCEVSFEHGIRKDQGHRDATSSWEVTGNVAESGVYAAKSPSVSTYTISTGQVRCSKLTFEQRIFYGRNGPSSTNVATRACVYATGTYGSGIDIKVKKENEDDWSEAPSNNPIYVKPDEEVGLEGTYTPSYQHTQGYKPYKVVIGSNSVINSGVNTLRTVFNSKVEPDWQNAFSIGLIGNTASFVEDANNGVIGSSDVYKADKIYKVGKKDPGSVIEAVVRTNGIDGTKTTPKRVGFEYNVGEGFTATVDNDGISDSAFMAVPYNFVNTTKILNGDEKIVYAGESRIIKYDISVNKRLNRTTAGTYATIVRDARWKLEVCFEGNCYDASEETGDLNENGVVDGYITPEKQKSINIPDLPAGSEVCVRSAVYPANSGVDTNLDASGSKTWQYSDSTCFVVAKRPSLQVWGGNIYSAGDIKTAVSAKNNVAGYTGYDVESREGDNYVFSSWGELGVVSVGSLRGLASGASTGYSVNNGMILSPDWVRNAVVTAYEPGGDKESRINTTICLRSVLTIANAICSGEQVGGLGGTTLKANMRRDKAALIAAFEDGQVEKTEVNGSLTLAGDAGGYYYGKGDVVLNGANISKGVYVVGSGGRITISGDLIYEGSYTGTGEVPKLLVYAKEIEISCNVGRIDATLVADGKVKTCAESSDINAGVNSKQLKINGTVIANELEANRTYGAATGANSMVSAEIINYDVTLYLWGVREADVSESGKMRTVYLKELSPRK